MSSYEVRPARDSDADEVAAVHASSSHAAYEAVVAGAHQTLPMGRRRAFWREAIEFGEPLVHVALQEGKIVGFAGFDRSRDPQSKATTGEIWALYVLPSHWGHGAGLALWDATREGLLEEGCNEVTVWVPLCNDRALLFFERAGFQREPGSTKSASIGGVKLEEIRLRRGLE